MVKYDEINHMHKRALMVSRKGTRHAARPKREQALDLLWAAQAMTLTGMGYLVAFIYLISG